jgi:uncharacterized protein (DUF2147 family)
MRAVVLAALALFASNVSATAAKPTGEWAVPGDVAHLRIADCGGRLWGVVSWERQPGIDSKNPDPAKRGQPTLGLPILLGMKRAEPNRWDGEIYNTSNGKIYSADIHLKSDDVLHVEGCVLGLLCGGQDWRRVKSSGRASNPSQADPPAEKSLVTKGEICSNARRAEGRP